MKSTLVAILLAVFWAGIVLGETPMEEFSEEYVSMEELDMDSLDPGFQYDWISDNACFRNNIPEEERKKLEQNTALNELWEHHKEEGESLFKNFEGCKDKSIWVLPLCYAEYSAKIGIFLIKFYANLNGVVDDETLSLIKTMVKKCLF